jgi:cytochrome c-type biogenesis protein CcmF
VRINLATPFYTQWMAPIGLVLLLLTGIGPLIAWRHATPANLAEQFMFPAGAGAVVTLGLAFVPGMAARTPMFHEKLELPVALVCFGFTAFVLASIAQEFYRGTRVRQAHTRLDFFTSLVGLVARNKRRYGGYLIHVAIAFMFIGFAGGAYKQETEVTLEKGQQATLGRYTTRFLGLGTQETPEKKIVVADVELLRGKEMKSLGHVAPAKWYFPHHEEEPVTHVVIDSSLREDLYLVLNGYDAQAGLINLKIVVNPLVNWIWIGFLLLAFGTLIALLPERAYQIAGAQAKEAAKAGAVTLLLLGLGLGLGLGEGAARAEHNEGVTVRAAPRTPAESELFKKIVCMCGTCGRQLLSDCTCSTAEKMRNDISKMVAEGKTVDQVIAYYLEKYPGESALAMPLDKGFNRLAWVLPYAALLAGVGALVVAARRMVRRPAGAPEPVQVAVSEPKKTAAAEPPTDEYEAKLDDELDDLD